MRIAHLINPSLTASHSVFRREVLAFERTIARHSIDTEARKLLAQFHAAVAA
jgi:hypothetical protein